MSRYFCRDSGATGGAPDGLATNRGRSVDARLTGLSVTVRAPKPQGVIFLHSHRVSVSSRDTRPIERAPDLSRKPNLATGGVELDELAKCEQRLFIAFTGCCGGTGLGDTAPSADGPKRAKETKKAFFSTLFVSFGLPKCRRSRGLLSNAGGHSNPFELRTNRGLTEGGVFPGNGPPDEQS